MLQQLLREESITLGLQAKSREEALERLVEAIPSWKFTGEQKEEILAQLLKREKIGTTAIGSGLALPHCVYGEVVEPVAVLGISPEGIEFSSLDGEPVHIIFLLVIPETNALEVKKSLLGRAEGLFRDAFTRERLKLAEFPEKVCEIIMSEEGVLASAHQVA